MQKNVLGGTSALSEGPVHVLSLFSVIVNALKVMCALMLSSWQVEIMVLVPGRGHQCPLAALAAGEGVYLLDPREDEPQTLHTVYGHPVTCLDASNSHVAFGVKSSGWAMHDGGNKVGPISEGFLYHVCQ